MMAGYCIGDIDASTVPKKTKYKAPQQPHYNQDKTSEFIIKILQFPSSSCYIGCGFWNPPLHQINLRFLDHVPIANDYYFP
ncbi:CYTOCHROME B5 [Salix purpurea]|uniref:CYTOCHROME B5 n=1 Tax=Salix purpurea TaxID=77065 RepID=A0A9Q1A1A3_SALPP|nr:CYTOCHROME B5 [Salix purpurea]